MNRIEVDPDGDVILQCTVRKPWRELFLDTDDVDEETTMLAQWVEDQIKEQRPTMTEQMRTRLDRYHIGKLVNLELTAKLDTIRGEQIRPWVVKQLVLLAADVNNDASTIISEDEQAELNAEELGKRQDATVAAIKEFVSGFDDGETLQLLVSSKLLSLASEFFKALFFGNFKEGTELSAFSAKTTQTYPVVLLQGDDALATSTLVHILHFKEDKIAKSERILDRGAKSLEEFAKLCDKYQCTHNPVLRNHVKMILDEEIQKRDKRLKRKPRVLDEINEFSLLVTAYIFKLEEQFSAIAWLIVWYHPGNIGPDSFVWQLAKDHPFLPTNLMRILRKKRNECCETLAHRIKLPISHRRRWAHLIFECPEVRSAIKSRMLDKNIRKLGLYLPHCNGSCEYCKTSLGSITKRIMACKPPMHFSHILRCPNLSCMCHRAARENSRKRYFTPGAAWERLFEPIDILSESVDNLKKDFVCLECAKYNCDSKDCVAEECSCSKPHGFEDSILNKLSRKWVDKTDSDMDFEEDYISSDSDLDFKGPTGIERFMTGPPRRGGVPPPPPPGPMAMLPGMGVPLPPPPPPASP